MINIVCIKCRLIRAVTKQRYLGAVKKIQSKNNSCHEHNEKVAEAANKSLANFFKRSWYFLFCHICIDVTHIFVTCKTNLCNYSGTCIINYNSPRKKFKKEDENDDRDSCVTVNYY